MDTTSSESDVDDMESYVFQPVMRKSAAKISAQPSRYGTLMEGSQTSSYETAYQNSRRENPFQESIYVPPTLSSFILDLPICPNNRVDNITLGHQALADTLGLCIPLANFPAIQKFAWKPPMANYSNSSSSTSSSLTTSPWNPWIYDGYHEGTHMFSIPPENSTYTIAGISIINQDPRCVWDVFRNPACRMVYDRMFCGYQVLDIINEYTKLIKMKFTMKHCMSLVERELVCVLSERQLSHTSFISASRSTHYPSPKPGVPYINKENLKLGSFLIEGIQKDVDPKEDAQSAQIVNPIQTKVTYILKGEFISLPKIVVEYILKRQPLCVAYAKMQYGWD